MRDTLPEWLTVTDRADGTVWFAWDRDATPNAVVAIVEAVATATNTDQCELSPLYDSLDPAPLSSLLEGARGVRVEFVEWNCRVVVREDDTIAVTPNWLEP